MDNKNKIYYLYIVEYTDGSIEIERGEELPHESSYNRIGVKEFTDYELYKNISEDLIESFHEERCEIPANFDVEDYETVRDWAVSNWML